MWLLFPLGQAVNRLLTRNKAPEGPWAERLTETFGTEEWREAFYKPNLGQQGSLFLSSDQHFAKDTDFEGIAGFFLERLGSIFHSVAPNYYFLRNSKNVPLYLLCFAAGDSRGAPTAIRIANHLLKQEWAQPREHGQDFEAVVKLASVTELLIGEGQQTPVSIAFFTYSCA